MSEQKLSESDDDDPQQPNEEEGEYVVVDERFARAVEHMAMHVSQGQSYPDIEPQQMSELFSYADKSDSRAHMRSMTLLAGVFGAILLLLVFVLILSWMFLEYEKSDLLVPVITAFGGLVTGLLGGFGIGAAYQRSQEPKSE